MTELCVCNVFGGGCGVFFFGGVSFVCVKTKLSSHWMVASEPMAGSLRSYTCACVPVVIQ